MYLKNASCIPFYLATWMLECMSEAFFVLNCENIFDQTVPFSCQHEEEGTHCYKLITLRAFSVSNEPFKTCLRMCTVEFSSHFLYYFDVWKKAILYLHHTSSRMI